MNIDTLKAILYLATPGRNSNWQERRSALDKAHKIMDSTGWSYASCGFTAEEAAQIENQFAVGEVGAQSEHKQSGSKSWNPFNWGKAARQAQAQAKPAESADDGGFDYRGRHWSPTDGWTYISNASASDWKPQTDYQGSVPDWDGYDGE